MNIVEALRQQADSDEKAGTLYAHELGRKAAAEIERLRRDCAEAYQVVGTLSGVLWSNESVRMEDVTKALDNLLAAAEGKPRPHEDLLPFPATPNAEVKGG